MANNAAAATGAARELGIKRTTRTFWSRGVSLWSNKMPEPQISAKVGPKANRHGRLQRENSITKRTANCQMATANCELPAAQSSSHQFFFRQSVSELSSTLLFLTAIFLLVIFYSFFQAAFVVVVAFDFSVAKLVRGCCACVWAKTDRTYISDYRAGLANSQPRCSTSSVRCVCRVPIFWIRINTILSIRINEGHSSWIATRITIRSKQFVNY